MKGNKLNINQVFLKVLLPFILITGSMKAFAVDEPYINEIKGTQVVPSAQFSVTDEKFRNPSAWALIDGSIPQKVDNIITFEFNFDQNYNFYQKPATCTINISITKYNNPADTSASFGTESIDLVVKYDSTTGSPYKGIAMYKFTGAFKFKVVVNSITSAEYGSYIPPIFRLKGQTVISRKYSFNDNSTDITRFLVLGNQLSLSWTPANYPGAEMFDLEWTALDDSSEYSARIRGLSGANVPAGLLDTIFRNNNTRITTAAASYRLNLAYDAGYILYRIRGVQLRDDAVRYEGAWNYLSRPLLFPNANPHPGLVHIDWHEPTLNWQYSMSFAEEGKKKEVISYFDGSLHNRQSVTINNSDTKSIIQETIYDALGRPSVNILPVPTTDSTIHYYRSFNQNTFNIPYSFADFQTGASCKITAQPLSTFFGAAMYYSPNNPFLGTYYFAKYIPDAHQFPFTVTEYTPDQTGRVQRQGGVGDTFQLNTGHETKYFYGKPNQNELDRLFGSEAGNSSHYLKNMVMDPNGQVSVSYINASGKTVATALAGLTPVNLAALPSNNDGASVSDTTQELINSDDFTRNPGDYSISATTTVMAASTGSYNFSYTVDPLKYEVLHGSNNQFKICSSCYYDLVITLKNNCNTTLHTEMVTAGHVFDTSCNAPASITGNFSADIADIGEYFITYTLKISKDALNFYDSVHLVKNTNIKKINYFLREELKQTDFSGCFNNCETCQDDLGTRNDFIDRFRGLYTKDSLSFQSEDSTWAGTLYDSLLANCHVLQQDCKKTPCQEKLDLIKNDVRPGSQYALYNIDSSGNYSIVEPQISVLSKYPSVVSFPDENGQPDSVTVQSNIYGNDSVRVPVNQLSLQQFIENWKESWADSLARFHPEYCYYLWCTVNSNSFEFDQGLADIDGATAKIKGYYNRNNFASILDHDPFFLSGGNGFPFRQEMFDKLRLFSRTTLGLLQPDRNILQYIDILLYCRSQYNAFDTCHVDDSCRSENREWNIYQHLYLNLKGYFNEKARRSSTNPVFANCSNCFIGSDGLSAIRCTSPPATDFLLTNNGINKIKITYKDSTSGVPHNVIVQVQYRIYCNLPGCENPYILDTLKRRFITGQSRDSFLYTSETGQHTIIGVFCDTLPASDFSIGLCNYNCPDGYYSPNDKPGVSLWVNHGNRYSPPSAPSSYGNCKYYSIIRIKTGASTSCLFTNVWVCSYDSACGLPQCNVDLPIASQCPSDTNAIKYINKHRIFNEYIDPTDYFNSILSGNPNQASAQNSEVIKAQGKSFCEAQADSWIMSLSKCTSDSVKLAQLKTQLILICSASADSAHLFGASDNYTDPSLTYHTFEDAIKGILGSNAINDSCAAELLSMPYPYAQQPVYQNRTIVESDYDICNKLHQFQLQYASSGFSGTLHQYLQKQLGTDYRLSEEELNDLKRSCGACNGILKNDIEIPIAFEKNARPCLVCDSANAIFTAFKLKFPAADSSTAHYEILLANYFNHRLGFSLSFDDYKEFLDSCKTPGNTLKLCNQSMQPPPDSTDNNSCVAEMYAGASTNAHNTYVAYIDSVRQDFRDGYMNKCLSVQPHLTMIAKLYEYHYTLYYYDQSGNLVKTVPPKGVKLLNTEEVKRVQLGRKYYRDDCYQYADELTLNTGYTSFANQPSMAVDSSRFSAEAFVYFASNATQGIFAQYDPATKKGYQFFVRNDSLIIRLSASDTNYIQASSTPASQNILFNAYNQVVVQRVNDPSAPVRLFINGNPVPLSYADSNFIYHSDITSTADLTVGKVSAVTPSFTGRIKQFRLYKREMTSQEIRSNYFDNCLQPTDKASLVVWAPMNEGSGTTVKNIIDNTGGTVSGTLAWISNRLNLYPHHELPSTYQYSSLNQVLQQYSPDGDTSHFWYDRLGRLVISQNKEQKVNASYSAPENRFSYTTYDALGRITEVGEKSGANTITTVNTKDTTALATWMASGTNKQVTRTIYDNPDLAIVTSTTITDEQLLSTSRKRVVASLFSEDGTFANNVYDNATHYAYDINGNVKTLWQEIGKMRPLSDNGIKRMDYDYDLVSGKVNKVMYQQGKGDQFFYKYIYDAENRVTDAQSSRDGLAWINDASYTYHLHGPLARTELGQNKVQGIDYAYTLQGWLKGINASVLNASIDMGKDGNGFSTTFGRVARDVYGFTLGYYNNDYASIGGSGFGLAYSYSTPNSSTTGSALYNGNISHTTLALNKFDTGAVAGYTYGYDQLNRLLKMNRHTPSGTTWNNTSIIDAYKERISYDANGNILSYVRNGQTGNELMDSLYYKYKPSTNELDHVNDGVSSSNYTVDIDDQDTLNYHYDHIGNLKKDVAEGIDTIRWTVYGKINKIVKTAAGTNITYDYDASGNRTTKKVAAGDSTNTTFYVRDAQGNVMGIYSQKNTGNLKWDEQHLYGSSRLGIWRWNDIIPAGPPNVDESSIQDSLLYGTRNYELTNHLGNVLATISDKKIGHALNDTTVDYFNADVVNANDYYPGGMEMPGRQYKQVASTYRYGFQKQEIDKELWNGAVSFENRVEDPRLVRFFSVDPIASNYPYYSPYQFSGNRLIDMVELEGLEPTESGSYGGQGAIAPKLDDKGKAVEGTQNQRWSWNKDQWNSTKIGVTQNELTTLFKGGNKDMLKTLETTVNLEGASYGIASQKELNGFIAQTAHETLRFTKFSEDVGRYSFKNLRSPTLSRLDKYSDEYLKSVLAKGGDAVAVLLYGGEAGGLDYRGRGLIQVTLKDNYRTTSAKYNKMYGTSYDFTKTPGLLSTDFQIGVRCSLIFFKVNGLFGMTNYNIDDVSKKVNKYDSGTFPTRSKLFDKVNGIIK